MWVVIIYKCYITNGCLANCPKGMVYIAIPKISVDVDS